MSMTVYAVLFLILATVWLALPLVPALLEFFRPSDSKPLHVYQGNAANASDPFYIYRGDAENASDLFSSTTSVVNKHDYPGPSSLERGALLEIAGEAFIDVVDKTTAALKAPSLRLGEHAVFAGKLGIEGLAHVEAGAVFRFLQAKSIRVGKPTSRVYSAGQDSKDGQISGASFNELQKAWRADNFTIPNETRITGDIIAKGSGKLCDGSAVHGSIRCHGVLELGERVRVAGNLVADRIVIGPGCVIDGSVMANFNISVGPNTCIGLEQIATVSATTITLGTGVQVNGAIQAHQHAQAVSS